MIEPPPPRLHAVRITYVASRATALRWYRRSWLRPSSLWTPRLAILLFIVILVSLSARDGRWPLSLSLAVGATLVAFAGATVFLVPVFTARSAQRTLDILPEYSQRIVSDCKLSRPMKIVCDSGNGIPGASAPGILRALGCEVIELFSEVDGDFPNHHPDPSKPENLADLIAAVKANGAGLGLAFDGDGDRLGVVTKEGNNIFPDRQIMLFATIGRAHV